MVEPATALSRAQSEVATENYNPDKPYPTEKEFATLPRVAGSIPWTAWTVAIVEFAERFSYYGTTAVCKYHIRTSRSDDRSNTKQSSTLFRSRFLRDPIPVPVSSSLPVQELWEWASVHPPASPPVRYNFHDTIQRKLAKNL